MFPHLSEALPRFGTVQEVAPLLHMHEKTVERKLRAGELPGRKLGKRWLVNLDELRRLLGEPPGQDGGSQ